MKILIALMTLFAVPAFAKPSYVCIMSTEKGAERYVIEALSNDSATVRYFPIGGTDYVTQKLPSTAKNKTSVVYGKSEDGRSLSLYVPVEIRSIRPLPYSAPRKSFSSFAYFNASLVEVVKSGNDEIEVVVEGSCRYENY